MRNSVMSIVLATVLLGGVAGCGGGDAAPAAAPADQAFPLTVTRRGGFVGVDDSARIAADGSAVVTAQGRPPVRTSLSADAVAELGRLMATPAPSAGVTVCNDGYEYGFTSPSATMTVVDCDTPRDRKVAIVAPLFHP